MLLFIVLSAVIATSAIAAEQHRPHVPAWRWSDQDRIAARVRVDLAAERLADKGRTDDVASKGKLTAAASARNMPDLWVDVIDGRAHPELFLPTELFHQIIVLGYVVNDSWRDSWANSVKAAGLPANFWARLEVLAAPYIADSKRESAALADNNTTTSAKVDLKRSMLPLLCREAFDSLVAAREEFGEPLDRFMYEYVARERVDYVTSKVSADELDAQSRGCR